MEGRTQLLAIIAGIGLSVAIFALGFQRVTRDRLGPGRVAWSLPFGGPHGVAKNRGMDGKEYGPLAFSVGFPEDHATLWLADTYHFRVMKISQHHTTIISTPKSFLEDVGVSNKQQVFFADNQGPIVLSLKPGSNQPAALLKQHGLGYTETIWNLAVAGRSNLWIEWVRIGHGTIHSQLERYVLTSSPREVVSAKVVNQKTIGWLAVSPSGQLYLQPLWDGQGGLWLQVYSEQGRYLKRLHLLMPRRSASAQLLGVDRRGNIYIFIPSRHRVQIFNAEGQATLAVPVPRSPLHAWDPGYVAPDGSLFMMASSQSRFRILRFRWHRTQLWSWHLPWAGLTKR